MLALKSAAKARQKAMDMSHSTELRKSKLGRSSFSKFMKYENAVITESSSGRSLEIYLPSTTGPNGLNFLDGIDEGVSSENA